MRTVPRSYAKVSRVDGDFNRRKVLLFEQNKLAFSPSDELFVAWGPDFSLGYRCSALLLRHITYHLKFLPYMQRSTIGYFK
jgi:hypothetical protein